MIDPGRPPTPDDATAKRFETTRWPLIAAAQQDRGTRSREALAILCSAYWYPLYAFVRRKGYDSESAQDLVQGFFVRLLERDYLGAVDPTKGRFRSFLMAACSHYLANQADHDRARKRGGGRIPVSIDRIEAEGRYGRGPADHLTPERLYERQWAVTLLDRVLSQLEAEMAQANKSDQFATLRPALLGNAERVPYAQIASMLGTTEEAARAAASRLRRRYRELLREEVTQTLGDPSEVDQEIRDLFSTLGG